MQEEVSPKVSDQLKDAVHRATASLRALSEASNDPLPPVTLPVMACSIGKSGRADNFSSTELFKLTDDVFEWRRGIDLDGG
jgi:hypothetical protein